MIFSTNRTASLSDDIAVDVNESYFGAGALSFMQENAQDELALFEAAIKSDIEEANINESATDELTALTEGFVEKAKNKIEEMMKKFVEWLKAVAKSAVVKLSQLLTRDNATFVKNAEKMLVKKRNAGDFKYSGKAVNTSKEGATPDTLINSFNGLFTAAKNAKTKEEVDKVVQNINTKLEEFDKLGDREAMLKETIITVENKDIKFVYDQLNFLKSNPKKDLDNLRKSMKTFEAEANKIVKEVKSRAKSNENEAMKESLNAMAIAASKFREVSQSWVKDTLYLIKAEIKTARAVVAKAMGTSSSKSEPKNESIEYAEELIDAMIETANYEYDEALEEMSEGKECDDCEDGAEPDDEE